LKYEKLFDGTLGDWRCKPVSLELKPGVTPYAAKPFPIPKIHEAALKKEIERLLQLKVLVKDSDSPWCSPTFIIAKKDGTVRFVTDFRVLNSRLLRKPYPIPNIGDLLAKLEGFTFATALDLNMGYYNIRLTPDASSLCTIVTPWGKYKYLRLPMGISCAPDIFQDRMNDLLGDLEFVRAYLDDLLVLTKGSFEDHLQDLEVVLERLQKAGLKCNAPKCSFAKKEMEYLGYIITSEGIKPDPKKVEAILALERPKTVKDVRRLLGMIQYYRDIWRRRSHILSPLTQLIGGEKSKVKNKVIQWNEECEQAFTDLKKMVAQETMLAYPDFTKKFVIYTDASDRQLGAVIMQEGKPLAFYSRKLNKAQMNYSVTEKELLSIVETLKEFRNILLGYQIEIYTDHLNLTYETTLNESQRVMRWRLLIEEFGPTLTFIKGEANVVADALSRLPRSGECESMCLEELLNLEGDETEGFPLEIQRLKSAQDAELSRNKKLQKEIIQKDSKYGWDTYDNVRLLTYKEKLYVPPEKLRTATLNWYHHYLCHPGGDRLANTIGTTCKWPGLIHQAREWCVKCSTCQKFKKRNHKYGHLPPKEVGELKPWDTVCVDLIGPYKILAKQRQPDGSIKKKDLTLCAMTFVDPATGWFEIAEIPYVDYCSLEQVVKKSKKDEQYLQKVLQSRSMDKSSARISQLFNQVWLSRYPRPRRVIFDNGVEFKKDFLPLLADYDIKPKLTTVKNPQANAAIERIHQVVHNMMRTQDLKKQIFDHIDPWGELLASIAWAIRCSHHSTLGATPAQLVFGRDMLFNVTHLVDWKSISRKKQHQVDADNKRENKGRISHDYQPGQYVYIIPEGVDRKYEWEHEGPFRIVAVHTNGTVDIQDGVVTERINIRRLTPHFGDPPE
jgi:hypothetical protein